MSRRVDLSGEMEPPNKAAKPTTARAVGVWGLAAPHASGSPGFLPKGPRGVRPSKGRGQRAEGNNFTSDRDADGDGPVVSRAGLRTVDSGFWSLMRV